MLGDAGRENRNTVMVNARVLWLTAGAGSLTETVRCPRLPDVRRKDPSSGGREWCGAGGIGKSTFIVRCRNYFDIVSGNCAGECDGGEEEITAHEMSF